MCHVADEIADFIDLSLFKRVRFTDGEYNAEIYLPKGIFVTYVVV